MESFVEKISGYDLFNNLFPGSLIGFAIEELFKVPILSYNIVLVLVLYYFLGLIISRIGSITVGLIEDKTNFIKKSDYYDYIDACKKDNKIEILAETANIYRSLFMIGNLVFLFLIISIIFNYFTIYKLFASLLSIFVSVLFLFSYKKQLGYINKRIERYKR